MGLPMATFFRENTSLKVASLALAIGVWAYVRGEEKPIQIFSVPLELQNLPPGMTLSGSVQDTVNVRVQAPETVLRGLVNETLVARVDLAGLGPGEQTVRVGPDAVRIPPGAEVVRVSPEFVEIRIEKKVQSELPITARIVGTPAFGYVLGQTTVTPARTRVEGPESRMAKAREVDTETIRIDGRSQPFEVMVDLYPAHPELRVIGEAKVLVHVNIHEKYVTRTVPGVAIRGDWRGLEVDLNPRNVEVTLEGPPALLAGLGTSSLTATLDLAALGESERRGKIVPRIGFLDSRLDGKVFVVGVLPESVSVHVER